jgi:hypothetical protein
LVEVEIISIDNLRFPFPGVVGIYQAGNRFSAVHAAGRVKNADEKQEISHTQESNWTCKFGPDVTPFFHYFNGPVLPRDKSVTVVLRSPQGISVAKKEVHVGHLPPFGSQLFLVTDIFDCSGLEPGSFVSVQVEHNAVFPRLIVGNLFLSTNFLEVTHSFPIIDKKDYCPTDNSAEYQSMLCAYTHPDLALRVRVFPTNCEGSFDVKVSRQAFSDRTLVDTGDSFHQTSRDDSEPLRFSLADEERFRCLNMIGNTVPSRFNASYVYSVRGLDTSFSTDIADGADSSVYPPKWRHWGHAFLDEGYESVVLIRNNTHTPSKTRFAKGKLSLYSEGYERTTTVEVEAESAIEVAKFMDGFASQSGGEPRFISWFLEMDEPTCETFWLVYRKSDGSIFGDHGI